MALFEYSEIQGFVKNKIKDSVTIFNITQATKETQQRVAELNSTIKFNVEELVNELESVAVSIRDIQTDLYTIRRNNRRDPKIKPLTDLLLGLDIQKRTLTFRINTMLSQSNDAENSINKTVDNIKSNKKQLVPPAIAKDIVSGKNTIRSKIFSNGRIKPTITSQNNRLADTFGQTAMRSLNNIVRPTSKISVMDIESGARNAPKQPDKDSRTGTGFERKNSDTFERQAMRLGRETFVRDREYQQAKQRFDEESSQKIVTRLDAVVDGIRKLKNNKGDSLLNKTSNIDLDFGKKRDKSGILGSILGGAARAAPGIIANQLFGNNENTTGAGAGIGSVIGGTLGGPLASIVGGHIGNDVEESLNEKGRESKIKRVEENLSIQKESESKSEQLGITGRLERLKNLFTGRTNIIDFLKDRDVDAMLAERNKSTVQAGSPSVVKQTSPEVLPFKAPQPTIQSPTPVEQKTPTLIPEIVPKENTTTISPKIMSITPSDIQSQSQAPVANEIQTLGQSSNQPTIVQPNQTYSVGEDKKVNIIVQPKGIVIINTEDLDLDVDGNIRENAGRKTEGTDDSYFVGPNSNSETGTSTNSNSGAFPGGGRTELPSNSGIMPATPGNNGPSKSPLTYGNSQFGGSNSNPDNSENNIPNGISSGTPNRVQGKVQSSVNPNVFSGHPTGSKTATPTADISSLGDLPGVTKADGQTILGETATTQNKKPLGFMSAQFEGAAGNPVGGHNNDVDMQGNPHGISYGKYSFNSFGGNSSGLAKAISSNEYMQKNFAGLTPGTPEFTQRWTDLAKTDKDNFANAQDEMAQSKWYKPAADFAKQQGFKMDNQGVREAIFSGSIQHGGIKKILARTAANNPGFSDMSPQDQLKAYYDERTKYYGKDARRYQKELTMATNIASGKDANTPQGINPKAATSADLKKIDESLGSKLKNEPLTINERDKIEEQRAVIQENIKKLDAQSVPQNQTANGSAAADKVQSTLGQMNAPSVAQLQGGKTRNLPIQEGLRQQLQFAAEKAGVNVEITSGGQTSERDPSMKNRPGGWTGSHRHDDGGAGDLQLTRTDPVTGQKRTLDFNNPDDAAVMQQFTKEAVRAGATGVGAANSYMGGKTMHIGGGSPAVWGGGGQGPAPFIAQAFAEGRADTKAGKAEFDAWKAKKAAEAAQVGPSSKTPTGQENTPNPVPNSDVNKTKPDIVSKNDAVTPEVPKPPTTGQVGMAAPNTSIFKDMKAPENMKDRTLGALWKKYNADPAASTEAKPNTEPVNTAIDTPKEASKPNVERNLDGTYGSNHSPTPEGATEYDTSDKAFKESSAIQEDFESKKQKAYNDYLKEHAMPKPNESFNDWINRRQSMGFNDELGRDEREAQKGYNLSAKNDVLQNRYNQYTNPDTALGKLAEKVESGEYLTDNYGLRGYNKNKDNQEYKPNAGAMSLEEIKQYGPNANSMSSVSPSINPNAVSTAQSAGSERQSAAPSPPPPPPPAPPPPPSANNRPDAPAVGNSTENISKPVGGSEAPKLAQIPHRVEDLGMLAINTPDLT